jgi:hypothetical protein
MNHHLKRQHHEQARKRHRQEQREHLRELANRRPSSLPRLLLAIGLLCIVAFILLVTIG